MLIAAAYFHAKFENTHPFADGNGRVGRLAMNYLPVLHGHPPVIIHEEDRKKYYGALEAWDARQELVPLREFLIGQTEKMSPVRRVWRDKRRRRAFLLVLPSSCSITPPTGEGKGLRQMVGGTR